MYMPRDTPLHIAAERGDAEVVWSLCNAGAERDSLVGPSGEAPLHVAARMGHVTVARRLCDAGANADLQLQPSHQAGGETEATAGLTPLHVAWQSGHTEVAYCLCEKRADLDQPMLGKTLLHFAARSAHVRFVRYLCEAGADKDRPARGGGGDETPLHVAARLGHLEVVRCLCVAGAEKDKPAQNGETPLHDASHRGHLCVVLHLCHVRADAAVALPNTGETALQLAVKAGYREVAQHLAGKVVRPLPQDADKSICYTTAPAAEHSIEIFDRKHGIRDGAEEAIQVRGADDSGKGRRGSSKGGAKGGGGSRWQALESWHDGWGDDGWESQWQESSWDDGWQDWGWGWGHDSSSNWDKGKAKLQSRQQGSGKRLYVANLPVDIWDQALWTLFGTYGRVENVHIMREKAKRDCLAAFVDFSSRFEADAAIDALHQTHEFLMGGGLLIVNHAMPKTRSRRF